MYFSYPYLKPIFTVYVCLQLVLNRNKRNETKHLWPRSWQHITIIDQEVLLLVAERKNYGEIYIIFTIQWWWWWWAIDSNSVDIRIRDVIICCPSFFCTVALLCQRNGLAFAIWGQWGLASYASGGRGGRRHIASFMSRKNHLVDVHTDILVVMWRTLTLNRHFSGGPMGQASGWGVAPSPLVEPPLFRGVGVSCRPRSGVCRSFQLAGDCPC